MFPFGVSLNAEMETVSVVVDGSAGVSLDVEAVVIEGVKNAVGSGVNRSVFAEATSFDFTEFGKGKFFFTSSAGSCFGFIF